MFDYYSPDGQPIDMHEWSRLWCDPAVKIVQKSTVGKYAVSTVYLGSDHGWGDGPPLIFESMIFGDGPMDQERIRYTTREQALEGHAELVKRCEFAIACELGDPA